MTFNTSTPGEREDCIVMVYEGETKFKYEAKKTDFKPQSPETFYITGLPANID
jgi:hypothetical protein